MAAAVSKLKALNVLYDIKYAELISSYWFPQFSLLFWVMTGPEISYMRNKKLCTQIVDAKTVSE